MQQNQNPSGRKKEATPLGEALEELLKTYRLKDKFDEKLIIQAWPEMMGRTVAIRTEQVYIRDKKLFVKISSGPVKSELNMNRSKVMAMIESKFGEGVIKEIVVI